MSGFDDILPRVIDHTQLPEVRLRGLYESIQRIEREGIVGDLVECGVDQGGSAALMGLAARGRRLWLYDSCQGLPEPGEHDPPEAWDFVGYGATPFFAVEKFLVKLGIHPYSLVAGWFADTLPEAEVERIALLHIDCDWHDSVKVCLEHLYDRVVAGGIIQIDDYGAWAGARKAVDDFLAACGIATPLEVVDYTARRLTKEPKG